MARLILDTSVLVAAARDASQLDDVFADTDDVAIAAITAAELLVGVELAGDRRRARRAEFVEGVLEAVAVCDYDLEVARAHAALLAAVQRVGRPRGAHDLILAATARASEREIVTSDATGFNDLPGVLVRLSRTND